MDSIVKKSLVPFLLAMFWFMVIPGLDSRHVVLFSLGLFFTFYVFFEVRRVRDMDEFYKRMCRANGIACEDDAPQPKEEPEQDDE